MNKLKNTLGIFFASTRKVLPANAKITHEPPNTFKTMKIPHIAGSVLGLLPTCGVMGNSPANLRFRWFSLKTAYALLYLFVEGGFTCVDSLEFLGRPKRSLFFGNVKSDWKTRICIVFFFGSEIALSMASYAVDDWVFYICKKLTEADVEMDANGQSDE